MSETERETMLRAARALTSMASSMRPGRHFSANEYMKLNGWTPEDLAKLAADLREIARGDVK